ncbi:GNAT family N-acetyltransferase [Actinokineospora pegani]|uniref:GNAT family N-acetyltransferase n=1 Tax=Actinokineospora pegani TaxID=2654637 RepID=UPI0012EA3BC6|nr:GNAT family N-acetyltransferase [Actinokineospora pegani]
MGPEVRPLGEDDLRASYELFLRSLLVNPVKDAEWEVLVRSYQPGRAFGAYLDGTLAGTAMTWGSALRVPGGADLPTAMLTRVGVRADFRRRGLLTALMRATLADSVERGEVFSTLHASEPVIYGRFGYGVATRAPRVAVRTGVPFAPTAPTGGRVRLVEQDEAVAVLPDLYARVGRTRPGALARPAQWWRTALERPTDDLRFVIHAGPDGDDGFAVFSTVRDNPDGPRLDVPNLVAADDNAVAGLWRFLLSIDLAAEVSTWARPPDELVRALFTDPRAITDETLNDDLWLRVVDVPRALAERTWAGPTVIKVNDPLLPANAGVYTVSESGVHQGPADPDVEVDADVLARLYLGEWSATALAAVGRLRARSPEAAARADRAFRLPRPAWCGTYF